MTRKLGKLFVLVAVVALAAFLFRGPLLTAVGSYLVRAEPPQPADIAVVLAGDGHGNRILKGAELVKQGFVPKVLVSGPDGNYGAYECDLAIPFAVRAGYPESYFIHAENHARSTRDEVRAMGEYLHKMGAHRVIVVTSDFHTRRAGVMYREGLPDMQFIVVAAPDTYFSPNGWWHNREGQKTALYEWMKTAASWFKL